MNPVYLRLLEIAHEQGECDPVPGTYFQSLLGLTSGRISQISDPLSVAKIGSKGLSRLAKLGYNPEWVNYEALPKRLFPSNGELDLNHENVTTFDASKKKSKRQRNIDAILTLLREIDDDGVIMLLGQARMISSEQSNKRKQAK